MRPMHDALRNAGVVCTCCVCVTAAFALEQFSDQPVDITPANAEYAGGTVVVQPAAGFVASLPHSRVEPAYEIRELRWHA